MQGYTLLAMRQRKKRPRVRYDPRHNCTVTWRQFKEEHPDEDDSALLRLWFQLPRRIQMPRARVYNGAMYTWKECCKEWSWNWDTDVLYDWFLLLPRVD